MNIRQQMIVAVQQYEMLYVPSNPEYKNVRKKRLIWEAIGEQLGMDGIRAARKWKDIRDSFVKAQRKPETPPYKYSPMLEFLMPYIKVCPYPTQISLDFSDDGGNDDNDVTEMGKGGNSTDVDEPKVKVARQLLVLPRPIAPKPRKKDTDHSLVAVKREYLAHNVRDLNTRDTTHTSAAEDDDDDDEDYAFFRSMAAACKKFDHRLKSIVKFNIHQLIHEAELQTLTPMNAPQFN